MSLYAIWDKQSDILCPNGSIYTADEWKSKYPIARTNVPIVCGGGVINGAYFGILPQMIEMYEAQGCDFSECRTDQDYLDVIEEFSKRTVPEIDATMSSALDRIAAALETQALLSMDDVNLDDPDAEV